MGGTLPSAEPAALPEVVILNARALWTKITGIPGTAHVQATSLTTHIYRHASVWQSLFFSSLRISSSVRQNASSVYKICSILDSRRGVISSRVLFYRQLVVLICKFTCYQLFLKIISLSRQFWWTDSMVCSIFLATIFLISYSRNVNRLVCSTFIALVASRASMTHEMLISLAPIIERQYCRY